jgi:hypothetical protein
MRDHVSGFVVEGAMMIQIGPLKYIKKEESTVLASFVLGFLVGGPVGLVFSMSIGVLKKVAPVSSSTGWTLVLLGATWILMLTCWTVAVVTSVLVSRRNGFQSKREIGKMIFGTVLVPLSWLLIVSVIGLVSTPIDELIFISFGISSTYTIDFLVFLPFVVLCVAIIIPDSRPGKALRRFIHHWRRHEQKTNA